MERSCCPPQVKCTSLAVRIQVRNPCNAGPDVIYGSNAVAAVPQSSAQINNVSLANSLRQLVAGHRKPRFRSQCYGLDGDVREHGSRKARDPQAPPYSRSPYSWRGEQSWLAEDDRHAHSVAALVHTLLEHRVADAREALHSGVRVLGGTGVFEGPSLRPVPHGRSRCQRRRDRLVEPT